MQEFDFCPNLIKFYPNFTQFIQIYPNFTQIYQLYTNLPILV